MSHADDVAFWKSTTGEIGFSKGVVLGIGFLVIATFQVIRDVRSEWTAAVVAAKILAAHKEEKPRTE
jgi:hypothetical protein